MQKNFTNLLARAITARLHLNAAAGVLLTLFLLMGNVAAAQTEILRNEFPNGTTINTNFTTSKGSAVVNNNQVEVTGTNGNRGYEGYIVVNTGLTIYPGVEYQVSIAAQSVLLNARLEITRGSTIAAAQSSSGNRILSSTTNNVTTGGFNTFTSNAFTVTASQTLFIGFFVQSPGDNNLKMNLDNLIITQKCVNFPNQPTNPVSASLCGPGSVSLSVSGAPAGGGYRWYTAETGGTAITGATSNIFNTPNLTTTTNYYVNTVSPAGCESATRTLVTATVNPIPVAPTNVSVTPTTICGSGTPALNATVGTNGTMVRWYLAPSGGSPVGTGTTYTPAAAISSTTTYYASSYNETTTCESTSRVAVTVTVNPVPVATITQGATASFCSGESITLTAQAATGNSYIWFEGDNQLPNQPNSNTLVVTEAGSYSVQVFNNGCSSMSAATVVSETALPTATINAPATTSLCAGEFITLSAETGTGYAYTWTRNGNIIPDEDKATLTVDQAGDYRVVVTANKCSATSEAVTITINPVPVATITAEGPLEFCEGGHVMLNGPEAPAGQTYTYEWFLNGISIQNESASSYKAEASGSYTLKVTSLQGCSNTSPERVVTVGSSTEAAITYIGETVFCEGEYLELHATLAPDGQPAYAYQWLRNNEAIPAAQGGKDRIYLATTTGSYQVVVSNAGCTKTSDAVAVTAYPQPVATIEGDDQFQCDSPVNANSTFIVTGSFVGDGATWSSDNDKFDIEVLTYSKDSETGQWQTTARVTTTGAGNAIISLTANRATTGCTDAVATIGLTVRPLPETTVSVGGPTTFCQGEFVILSAPPAPQGQTYTYKWFKEGGITPVGFEKDYKVSVGGNYYVEVTSNTCPATSEVTTVTVNPLPTAVVTPTGPVAICAGSSVVLNASSDTGTDFIWFRGTEQVGTGASYEAKVAGSYTVRVINGSCSNVSAATDVTVNPNPSANIEVIGSATFCQGGTVTLRGPAAPQGQTYAYQWFKGGEQIIAQADSRDYVANESGDYTVRVTNTSTTLNCNTTTATPVAVTVNPIPSFTVVNPAAVCAPGTVNLTAAGIKTNASEGLTYTYWANAAATTVLNNPSAVATSGTYYIKGTSGTGCAVVKSVTVTVNPLPTVSAGATQTNCQAIANGVPASTTFTLNGTSNVSNVTWSVFSQPSTVSAVSFSDNKALKPNVTITGYGSVVLRLIATGTGGCTTFSDVTINVSQRKKLTLVLEANPFPVCPGTNTRYKATVYEDAVVAWNTDRRDSVDVVSFGRDVSDQFTFDWWKNDKVDNQQGQTGRIVSQAGLSSTDYFTVRASLKAGSTLTCNYFEKTFSTGLSGADLYSNRIYLGYPEGYGVNVTAEPGNVICAGTSVKFTATANATYANPVWQWQVNGNNIQGATSNEFTTSTLKNGDVVRVLFGSAESICGLVPVSNEITMTVNALPAITSQPVTPRAVCAGQTVELTVGASGTGITYQWYKRAGNAQSAGIPVQNGGSISGATSNKLIIASTVASDAGFYYVVVSGICAPAATSNNTQLYITPIPTAYNVTGTGSYCQGGTGVPVGLDGSEIGVRYQLLLNGSIVQGAVVIGTGDAISFGDRTAAGTYTVSATTISGTTTAACPRTMTGSAIVTVNPLPTVTVNSPTTCAGIPATVTAVPSGGSGTYTTYTWTVPTGWSGPTPTTASFQTSVAGTYTVKVTDDRSCASSAAATSTVTVNELPEVTVTSPTVCAGDLATVTATPSGGTGPYSYTWVVPAGWTSPTGEINPGNVASFQTASGGEFKVSITDNLSCSSSLPATSTVTVNPLKVAAGEILVSNSEGTITDTNPIMPGSSITITTDDDITDAGVGRLYTWYIGNDAEGTWGEPVTTTTNTLIIEEVKPGEFDVKVEISAGNSGTICFEDLVLVTLNPLVPLPVEIIYLNASKQGNDVVLEWATAMEEDNAGFEVQVSTDGFSYRKLTFVPAKNGNSNMKQVYAFTDRENGKFGTRYYRLKQIDTYGTFEFFGPKAVTFGSVASKVIAFPNPFHDEVTLDIAAEADGEALITVTDAVGKKLLERKVQVAKGFTTEKLHLDAGLPRGLYIIKTQVGGYTQYIKMIKE